MIKVVVVKFKSGGKLYYFAPNENETYTRDMPVVVETAKGKEYAWVAYPEKEVDESEITPPLKSVVRIATEKDREFYKSCQEKKPQAMSICKEKIIELGLDMKLVDCEYAFDGSKIVFYFTSAGRVDFRELVRMLASTFKNRIELRQVGTRDETKYLGGIAPCGRICCCAGNMPEFKKVTIKMAKTQGLSLNPGKISGLCGRLMCCLSYENDYYAEASKNVPKIGAEARFADGVGTVVSVNMLKMEAKLRVEDGAGNVAYRDFAVADLQFKKSAAGEAQSGNATPPDRQQQPQAPCEKCDKCEKKKNKNKFKHKQNNRRDPENQNEENRTSESKNADRTESARRVEQNKKVLVEE